MTDRFVTQFGRPEAECTPHLVIVGDIALLVVGTRTIAVIPAETLAACRAQQGVVTLGPVA